MNKYKKIKRASILGIIGNIFLAIIKIIIALITKSSSMLSEAFNSTSDIISSLFTFIGNKIASKEPDEDHHLGHGKAEYIFSLLIGFVMVFLSLSLIINSIKSIFHKPNYVYSIFLIIIPIITIIVKLSLYIYTHNIAKKYKNILIEANALDHKNDCFLALLNLLSSFCILNNISYVDGIVGTLIALWITKQASEIIKESYDVLMDKACDDITKEKIMNIVSKYDEIKKTNHFNSTAVGYQYQISLTIFVDGNLSTYESHEIANRLEKEISSLDEVYLTIIHVNPI